MLDGVRGFYDQDVEAKAEWYTRDFSRRVIYNSNFDLFTAPSANWRDTVYCQMAPNAPKPEELPVVCRMPLQGGFTQELLLDFKINCADLVAFVSRRINYVLYEELDAQNVQCILGCHSWPVMVLKTKCSQKTHYQTMGVKEDASHEEIRKTYRVTILKCHPDKQQQTTLETFNHKHGSGNEFMEVQRAWEILSDQRSRSLYDNELQVLRHDSATADDLRLQDMTVEDAGDCFEFYYHCRCGDCFFVDSLELEEMGYKLSSNGKKTILTDTRIFACISCSSMWILLY
ncbi:hypothetical protein F511_12259 [Dorcoceras hygrometricum]|uniref:J domain-containing protein n=1 Tax=Dorcoceras hygrometricum TaxID=472368 RepID=A0A2Z7A4J3_9LAMI|nr:hypothetical protein F511_12259 [Dorcoceras hygrometricum]